MNLNARQDLEQSMQEEQIREALNAHWHASTAGDANAEHDIYDDDAIRDYPQSGERILGNGDLWITEYSITYQGRPAYTECKRKANFVTDSNEEEGFAHAVERFVLNQTSSLRRTQ